MKQETRVAIINKEIETYKKYINLIPTIEEVIKRFNNKCVNKKFDKALDETVNDGNTAPGQRKFYVSTTYGYNGRFEIKVTCYDDTVKEVNGKIFPDHYKIQNNTYRFEFEKDNFEITESGNYRIHADTMSGTLVTIKKFLEKEIQDLENGLAYADEMIEEMKRIKAEFEAFRAKYDYHIREIMGVNFDMRNNSGMEYTRYDI